MVLHWRIRTGSDWWFSKILRIRTGSDSILSDQDWTHTEKFHSPLISVDQMAVVPEPKNWQYLATTRVLFQTFFVNSVQVFHILQRIVRIVSCSQIFSTLFPRQSWHGDVLRPRTTGQSFLLQQSAWQCKAVPSSQQNCITLHKHKYIKGCDNWRSTDMAFLRPIPIYHPITDISKTFKSCFAFHYPMFVAFYALFFFKNLKNQHLWAKNCSNFNI